MIAKKIVNFAENPYTMKANQLIIRYFTFLICYVISCTANAQDADFERLLSRFNNANDQVQAANEFFQYVEKVFPGDCAITFSKGTPEDSLRQQVWYWAAEVYHDAQNYESARQYALRALPLFRYDNEDKAYCVKLLAIINVRLGDFSAAATYGKQALDITLKGGNADEISSVLNVLAGTYMAANQAEQAEQYILKGLEYAEAANNSGRKAILLGMASEVYHKLGQDRRAVDYAQSAYALDSAQGREGRAAVRLSQKAAALIGLEDYKDAQATLERAIPVLRATGNLHSLAISLNQLGFCMVNLQQNADAIPLFREASQIFDKMGDLYNLTHSHQGLYKAYWDINSDSARIELEAFNQLRDSLYSQASAEALSKYKAEFDADRLEAENEQIRKARQRDITIGVVLLIVLLAGVFVFIRRSLTRHRHAMQALISEVDEIRAAMNEKVTVEATKTMQQAVPNKEDEKETFLHRVVEAVEDGLRTGHTDVAHIAAELHLSEQTFRRRLVDATGQQPKMFISAIQMERAAEALMIDPERPISEVALTCGFEDASAFSHAFKRVYGVSPSRYRLNASTK